VISASVAYSIPWMEQEILRGAVQDARSMLQLARVEAVSRNTECRFVVDTSAGTLQALDTLGTADISDDRLLHSANLPRRIAFARPDALGVSTMQQIGGSDSYQVVFSADGVVAQGAGQLFVHGGDAFGSVGVLGAGGIQVSYWDGYAWHSGI
jgi:Tfp pilus assembly protein FimT